ncbi:SpoIIE family protein phosphatase [candidate division KSB1 bacterium]|nr:SpoIIE family protein phosphatase [candidate division KSB1 bacterium]
MVKKDKENENLHKQLQFYKKRIEELSGDNLKYDIAVSGLRHELRQRRKSFALLSELNKTIGIHSDISSLFEAAIQAINPTLKMDKTIVFQQTEKEHNYRPSLWLGFQQKDNEHLPTLSFEFPMEFAQGKGYLLVNKATESTPLIEKIRSAFELPFFICLPVMLENAPLGLLLSGRLMEAKPFYPPLDQGDADTFEAIADLITATIRNRRLTVLKEMDKLKTEFFANISHEFRTPITLTLGPLEQMLAGQYGEVSPQIYEQLLIMQRNQDRLLELINQILDLSKLEAGKMQLKTARMEDINSFIQKRIVQFKSVAEKRGLVLKTTLDADLYNVDLYIDREQFDKLFMNLLSNAIKFTKKGFIEIFTENKDSLFQMTIKDTGIGIRQNQLPHIFDRFHQADGSESREYAGTGLGLAMVKEIAKLHGGDITVRSEYGKGTVFQVNIPFGTRHLDPASIIELPQEDNAVLRPYGLVEEGATDQVGVENENHKTEAFFDPQKHVILYVEDNPDLRVYVRDLLKHAYNVFLATDGRDGLVKAKKYKPDLILTDQMMPFMSGRELLREIRKSTVLQSTPVLFLTARIGKQARIESLEASADDYICKPFDKEELLIRIKNMLKARSQEKKISELNRQLEEKIARQEAEIKLAANIQKDLLPGAAPQLKDYEIAGKNIAAKLIGGDYYDFIQPEEHSLVIALGDVCGKGLPASLLMANTQATIRGQAYMGDPANVCLQRSNTFLFHSTDSKTFVSLFYCILDIQNHILKYANAGQNPPLHFSPGKNPVFLQNRGLVLGALQNVEYDESETTIKNGDVLVLYSDGICEAMNEDNEEFGEQRLIEIVTLYKEAPAAHILGKILSTIDLFTRGVAQHDDMTLVIIKRK